MMRLRKRPISRSISGNKLGLLSALVIAIWPADLARNCTGNVRKRQIAAGRRLDECLIMALARLRSPRNPVGLRSRRGVRSSASYRTRISSHRSAQAKRKQLAAVCAAAAL